MKVCKRCNRSGVEFARFKYGKEKAMCVECNVKSAKRKANWKATPTGAASIAITLASEGMAEAKKRANTSDASKAGQKRWRDRNTEYNHERNAKWEKSESGRKHRRARASKKEYKIWRRAYEKEKYANSPSYRLVCTMRHRMWESLQVNTRKSATFFKYAVDFSTPKDVGDFIITEAKKIGLDFERYGSIWHVDHSIACFWYDFNNDEDVVRCWRKKNLAPMEKKLNQEKGIHLPAMPQLIEIGSDVWPACWKGVPPSAEEERVARSTRMRVVR